MVERAANVVTLVITCDTIERAKGMYDQICAEAGEGFLMLDLKTIPLPTLDVQTLPRRRADGGTD